VVVALVAALALIAPACGTDTAAPPSSAGAPVKVKIGILPIADVAPIWYGIDKGYFKAENIEVETVPAQGGAAIVPSVMSGEFQFGFSNVVSLLLARDKNNKVKLVSNMVNGMGTPDRHGANALLIAPGKGIESLKDLAGKKFAVNTQKNAGEVTIRATLRNAGVDDSGISFVEYAFPNMNAVLQSGQVDAAWQAEPFVTLGEDAGLKVIADPMYGTTPNLTIAGVFASEEYLAANADVAARFKRALAKALSEVQKDEAGIRATIGSHTQTPPPVVPRITLPNWQAEPNVASIELQGKLAKEFGILGDEPDTATFVWAP
jgi:NitT/TauT family transport system substrate-binding protein